MTAAEVLSAAFWMLVGSMLATIALVLVLIFTAPPNSDLEDFE